MSGWRHPLHGLPFDEPVANALAAEYGELPLGRRVQAWRKVGSRELALLLTGQARHRVDRVPAECRHVLWVYSWSTVGDAVMDLSARALLPEGVSLDLLIAPHLAPLFAEDARVRAVHTETATVPADIDFVLLDHLGTQPLRLKRRWFPALPFASMRGHQIGERFDRTAWADRRLRQLYSLPMGLVLHPRLPFKRPRAGRASGRYCDSCRIAVPLGARVAAKRYAHWDAVLRTLVTRWPVGAPRPHFLLLGQGDAARADLALLGGDLIEGHCTSAIDSGDLAKTARDLAGCDAFLGVDGGLMHVAVGVGTPGLALFARVDPAYFLQPDSTMQALCSAGEVSALHPEAVAAAFLATLPVGLSRRGVSPVAVPAAPLRQPAPPVAKSR